MPSSGLRRVMLLLDGSNSMNEHHDFLPNRLLALRAPIFAGIDRFTASNPLALMGLVVSRDYVGHMVRPLTNSAHVLKERLEERYFLCGGQGGFSLDNALKVCMSELSTSRGSGGGIRPTLEILAILGSVSSVDPEDIAITLGAVKKANIIVHVVSLSGAPYVFQRLATMTHGSFHTPLSVNILEGVIRRILDGELTPHHAVQAQSKEKVGTLSEVGFPVGSAQGFVCSRCHNIEADIPCTCSVCGLLLCCTTQVYVASASSAPRPRMRKVVVRATEQKRDVTIHGTSDTAEVECSCCGSPLSDPASTLSGTGEGAKRRSTTRGKDESRNTTRMTAMKCEGCDSLMCTHCCRYVQEELLTCPRCDS